MRFGWKLVFNNIKAEGVDVSILSVHKMLQSDPALAANIKLVLNCTMVFWFEDKEHGGEHL